MSAPNAEATCAEGVCGLRCAEGFADCDRQVEGCETAIDADEANCGMCGKSCWLGCNQGLCSDPGEVSAGYRHTCALLGDGTVACWGSNLWGEIGDANLPDQDQPRRVQLPGRAAGITAGGGVSHDGAVEGAHTCALMADGTAQCWGSDGQGQLGIGLNADNDPFPQPVVGLIDIEHIVAGGAHTCALRKGGDVYCWGSNRQGQVGSGSVQPVVREPTLVLGGAKALAAGNEHTCAVTTEGDAYCWGSASVIQLGVEEPINRTPVKVVGLEEVDEVSLGARHTCARRGTSLYCWGSDEEGQAGLNNFGFVDSPKPIALAAVTSIDMGFVLSGALSGPRGDVFVWGHGHIGEQNLNSTQPTKIGLPGVKSLSLGGGYGRDSHACALKATGEIICWGSDAHGQVGDGPDNADKMTPTAVLFR